MQGGGVFMESEGGAHTVSGKQPVLHFPNAFLFTSGHNKNEFNSLIHHLLGSDPQ